MLFVLILLAFARASFAQTAPTSNALQEAQKISAEAVRLFQQKKYDEAAPLAEKAIAIREKKLGKNHVSVAQAWRNLAYIQLRREKRKEAEKAFENAFEIYERNQPLAAADEKMFVEMLEAVAVYEATGGDIIGAEKKFARAVALREKTNGRDSAEVAGSLTRLAQIYQARGDYEKSLPLLLRALDIRTKETGILDDEAREIYSIAHCSLSKLNREAEREQLQKRFFPAPPEVELAVGNPDASNKSGTVKGGVVNGKALSLPKPIYPAEAIEKRASGTVSVQVLIDESGKVVFACAVSGARELQRVSEIAAYQAKFSPTLLTGQPVKVTGIITYNFVP